MLPVVGFISRVRTSLKFYFTMCDGLKAVINNVDGVLFMSSNRDVLVQAGRRWVQVTECVFYPTIKKMIYIPVLCDSSITAEPLYNTPLNYK